MTHITFLFAWLFSLPPLNKKLPFYIFTFWILLLFLSLRYNFGTDYSAYFLKHKYMYISSEPFWEQKEILYTYLNMLIPNFYWMIAIISIFYIASVHRLIRKNLSIKYYWMAILIWLINPYLFLIHLSSLRQTIAICFFIFAVHFAIKRRIIPFVLLIFVASGFHQSALIILPVYFLLTDKKIGKAGVVTILSALGLLLATPLFEVILNQIVLYFPKYGMYIETIQQNSLRSTLMTSFLFLFVLLNINKLEGREIVFGKLALFSTFITLLSIKFNMIGRIGMYFDIFVIIAFPMIISKFKYIGFKQIIFLSIITIYLLRYVSFFVNYNATYGTYRTILGY